jgi:hypothetical protein
MVFTGEQQKVGIGLVEAVQALGERGRFVRISGNGRNALDFHIAFYLGKLAASAPSASFLIVSNDGGYDPLIKHLNASGAQVRRIEIPASPAKKTVETVSKKQAAPVKGTTTANPNGVAKKTVKTTAASVSKVVQVDADRIVAMLKGMPNNRPKSEASLRRMMSTWLGSKDTARLDATMAELQRRGVTKTVEKKVVYKVPAG